MPILEIELVGEPSGDSRAATAQRLADAVAAVFDAPSGSVWVRLRVLPEQDYAENGGAEPGLRPVFVRLLGRTVPEDDLRRQEARALTAAVARVCDRATENVHVLYEPAGAGRQAFGGDLVG